MTKPAPFLPISLLKIFIFGAACLIAPKAIANPTPTTILTTDPTLAGKSTETRPFQVADSDSKEETQPAIAPVDSFRFHAGISTSASDLLPDEVKASGFITAQTESPPPEDSTTPAESNPAEPTKPADETPKEDSAAAESVTELAKKAQNPIANLISLPFQNNTNFGVGSLDRTQNVLNIQPVIPVSLGKDLLLITRTIVPVIYQPEPPQGGGGTFGLGDINPQFYFSPKTSSNVTWGVGPTFLFPTATSQALGQGKWGIGPAAVIVVTTKHLVFGAIGNNVWSVAGDSDRPSVSQLTFQPFINYNLDDTSLLECGQTRWRG